MNILVMIFNLIKARLTPDSKDDDGDDGKQVDQQQSGSLNAPLLGSSNIDLDQSQFS